MTYREHNEALCPKCRETLTLQTAQGVGLGFCQACHGLWLSARALQTILLQRGSQNAAQVIPHLDMGFSHESKRLCVSCQKRLLVRRIMDVEIDYCPQCKGVFLDPGELDAIALGEFSMDPNAISEEFASDQETLLKGIGKIVFGRRATIFDIFDDFSG